MIRFQIIPSPTGEYTNGFRRFDVVDSSLSNYCASAVFITAADLDQALARCNLRKDNINVQTKIIRTISARQLRLGLINRGIMPSQIISMLELIENPIIREKALVEFEYAQSVDSNHPLVTNLAQQLNMTEQDLDQFFINAAQL